LDDLIIGSHRVDLNGKSEEGKSYVIFGKTNTNAIDLTKLNSDCCLRQQQKFHHYWCLQRYRHFHYLVAVTLTR
jgi:hypothetical protein